MRKNAQVSPCHFLSGIREGRAFLHIIPVFPEKWNPKCENNFSQQKSKGLVKNAKTVSNVAIERG
jgi:hypothetical protein